MPSGIITTYLTLRLGFNANLLQSRCATLSFSREKTVKKKMRRNGYSRGVRVSALVHATPDATASRFAGRSANKTTPIAMKTTTSVKSLWTP
jgi:alkaline phosphatase